MKSRSLAKLLPAALAAGEALRERVPRASHAEFERKQNVDPVGILLGQAVTRVPELIPVRHARMLQLPFAFLRGPPPAADALSHHQSGRQRRHALQGRDEDDTLFLQVKQAQPSVLSPYLPPHAVAAIHAPIKPVVTALKAMLMIQARR